MPQEDFDKYWAIVTRAKPGTMEMEISAICFDNMEDILIWMTENKEHKLFTVIEGNLIAGPNMTPPTEED